ncbi:transcription factor E2FC isoform X1 [Olea europaea subsp. europaea]|uniref:Transcription factor E2FC isoform X1 n=1 Tax=Olea europaea subsp. europaea TaxID=158383 RepID=A0A8S0UT45_OLEEU|nr:transcription factor E2FC isoform X1 [Olea europaea subsp. europaea]
MLDQVPDVKLQDLGNLLLRKKTWEADDGTLDLNRTAEVLEAEVERPYAEERGIDNSIRDKLDHLSELGSNLNCQKNLLLTGDGLMSLPCFKNQTVIVVKAPHASCIEVPDPDERDNDYRLKSDHEVSAVDMWGKEDC